MRKLVIRIICKLTGLVDPNVVQVNVLQKIDGEHKSRFILNSLIDWLNYNNSTHSNQLRLMKANNIGDCGEVIGQARCIMNVMIQITKYDKNYSERKGE